MPQLSERVLQPEVMDQPGLDELLHAGALQGLSRVNWWSRTAGVIWRSMQETKASHHLTELKVLDLACGGGDVALRLAKLARTHGVKLTIHGWDRSDTAIGYARAKAERQGDSHVEFFQSDVLSDEIEEAYDLVYSTLFLHHLERADAVRLLQRMAAATRYTLLVDDLRRTAPGYALAYLGCYLLSRSPVVHVDGPLSVRAAFTVSEVEQIARDAGLNGVTICQHWPQRFLLSWDR